MLGIFKAAIKYIYDVSKALYRLLLLFIHSIQIRYVFLISCICIMCRYMYEVSKYQNKLTICSVMRAINKEHNKNVQINFTLNIKSRIQYVGLLLPINPLPLLICISNFILDFSIIILSMLQN